MQVVCCWLLQLELIFSCTKRQNMKIGYSHLYREGRYNNVHLEQIYFLPCKFLCGAPVDATAFYKGDCSAQTINSHNGKMALSFLTVKYTKNIIGGSWPYSLGCFVAYVRSFTKLQDNNSEEKGGAQHWSQKVPHPRTSQLVPIQLS